MCINLRNLLLVWQSEHWSKMSKKLCIMSENKNEWYTQTKNVQFKWKLDQQYIIVTKWCYVPGLQRRPSEASVWPWGHTQVNLGECLLTCGAGRHMKEQPPFSNFSLHQLVPGLRKQQYLVTASISLDSSRSHRLLSHRICNTCCCYCSR